MLTIPDLPPLTGSEKQVAWAQTVRDQLHTWYAADIATRTRTGWYTPEMGITPAMVTEAQHGLTDVFRVTEARFWIDNRDKGILGCFRDLYRRRKHLPFAEYDNICLSLQAMGL